jgi:hypothetical protein
LYEVHSYFSNVPKITTIDLDDFVFGTNISLRKHYHIPISIGGGLFSPNGGGDRDLPQEKDGDTVLMETRSATSTEPWRCCPNGGGGRHRQEED